MRQLRKQFETFRKSGISLEAQEGAMDDHDDPFKGLRDDGESESVVDELEFDLINFAKLDQT